jgi:uncharacterized protein (DUF2147 family)
MIKLAITTALAAALMTTSALAATWSVTEQSASGIKYASGTWNINNEGDKVTGKADLQLDNGSVLTYKLDGSIAGGVYTVNLVGRDDSKKNCVWTGKAADGLGGKVFTGEAVCEGTKMTIRGGLQ